MIDYFSTHSAGFDSPIELLQACHEKVRRFTRLSQRIAQHIDQVGIDNKAQEAAESVLRYFTIAAPLHHQDEEEDLFPALRAISVDTIGETAFASLNQTIDALEAEHESLGALWSEVAQWLNEIYHNRMHPTPACLNTFVSTYQAHAELEEQAVYPYANELAARTLHEIGMRMAHRRGHKSTT